MPVLALVAVAAGVLAGPAGAARPGTAEPRLVLAFDVGPSTVQQTGSTVAGPGVTPVLVMCDAVTVSIRDGSDPSRVFTGGSHAVTLTATGGGLRLNGGTSLVATTTDGVATFGTCAAGITATTLGLGLQMSASARIGGQRLTATAADTFDVLPVYGDCSGECSTGQLRRSGGDTTAQLTASGGDPTQGGKRLTFYSEGPATGWDGGLADLCDPDPDTDPGSLVNPYRDVVTVDLLDHTKDLMLTWSKQAVRWATNNGASLWQVCLATTYPFETVEGDAVAAVVDGESGWFVGHLLPCDDDRVDTDPCLTSNGRNAGNQVAVVHIPDVDGDPKAF